MYALLTFGVVVSEVAFLQQATCLQIQVFGGFAGGSRGKILSADLVESDEQDVVRCSQVKSGTRNKHILGSYSVSTIVWFPATSPQEGTFMSPRHISPRHIDLVSHMPQPGVSGCRATRQLLDRIGDKWSIYIIAMLANGTLRFNELKREIDGISQRMLTLTLRGLERDGLITRRVYPTIPPRVDYELTVLGKSLLEPVLGLVNWANENLVATTEARDRFDVKPETDHVLAHGVVYERG
jgi:DNA-binding HxlR family transcriptional regulator